MDYFLDQYDYTDQGNIFFLEHPITIPVPVIKRSAFVKYVDKPAVREVNGPMRRFDSLGNMNKRVIEFLRRNPVVVGGGDSERERGRRHMISERIRREKQRNSYMSLHSVLPPGTKNDKNSIVQVAAKEVEELTRWKEELKRRNYELERRILELNGRKSGEEKEEDRLLDGAKIKMKVAYPSSGIDSMLGVLKCLKETESIPRFIHSQFSPQEFSAVLEIESKKMEASEVEKAVHRSLYEVERNFRFHFPQG